MDILDVRETITYLANGLNLYTLMHINKYAKFLFAHAHIKHLCQRFVAYIMGFKLFMRNGHGSIHRDMGPFIVYNLT